MPSEQSPIGMGQLPECGWCGDPITRLGGNVETELCGSCLHKGQCGWAPDKDWTGWPDERPTDGVGGDADAE